MCQKFVSKLKDELKNSEIHPKQTSFYSSMAYECSFHFLMSFESAVDLKHGRVKSLNAIFIRSLFRREKLNKG